MQHLEIYTVETNGIKVKVKIDYDKEQISLVENDRGGYYKKNWLFAERGLEYMQGWKNILEAMEVAINDAANRLQTFQDRKTEELAELMLEMQDASDAIRRGIDPMKVLKKKK